MYASEKYEVLSRKGSFLLYVAIALYFYSKQTATSVPQAFGNVALETLLATIVIAVAVLGGGAIGSGLGKLVRLGKRECLSVWWNQLSEFARRQT
jgi:hypothetical protein